MAKYRNVRTGREIEFETEHEGLEASDGWERVAEPSPAKPAGQDKNEGSKD